MTLSELVSAPPVTPGTRRVGPLGFEGRAFQDDNYHHYVLVADLGADNDSIRRLWAVNLEAPYQFHEIRHWRRLRLSESWKRMSYWHFPLVDEDLRMDEGL